MTNLRQLKPDQAIRLIEILRDLIHVGNPNVYPRVLEVIAAVQPGLTDPIAIFNRPREKDGALQPIQLIQVTPDMSMPWLQCVSDMLTEKLLMRAAEIGIDVTGYKDREALYIEALQARKPAIEYLFDVYDEWFPGGYTNAKAKYDSREVSGDDAFDANIEEEPVITPDTENEKVEEPNETQEKPGKKGGKKSKS